MEDQIFHRKATDVNHINDLLLSMYEKQYELIDISTWFEDPTNYGDCIEETVLLSFVKWINCYLYFYKYFSVRNKSVQDVVKEMNVFIKQKDEEGYILHKTLTLSSFRHYAAQNMTVSNPNFVLIFKKVGEILIPVGDINEHL